MRTIKMIHEAEYRPIDDLITYSPLPSTSIQQVDPFLFLNHHGPQHYAPDNNGLPFGPHPHRGMETVTFILEGDIMHKDSDGHESVITAGGVQWMTAGKGLIHAEVSSDEFKMKGGDIEILQLWLNLPSRLKMTKPSYKGLQKKQIPEISIENEKVVMNLVSGIYDGINGAFDSVTNVFLSTLEFQEGGRFQTDIPVDHDIFLYVVRGTFNINGKPVESLHLVEFINNDEEVMMEAETNGIIIFGHAQPINEPVVARGPFVMNTDREIQEAYQDYYQGKFGHWNG